MRTLVLALFVPSVASAACPYGTDALLDDLLSGEEALRAGVAPASAAAIEAGLGCLDEVVRSPALLARAYRLVGAGALAREDEGTARQWLATAVEIDPVFEYGIDEVPADHPVRQVLADLRLAATPPAEPVEGADLVEGSHWLDGRPLDTPAAVAARPHLYQWEGQGSWLIEGNAFPEEALGQASVADASEPRRSPRRVGGIRYRKDGVGKYPAGKDPMIVGSIATIVGSGVLYGMSAVSHQRFASAGSSADVHRYGQQTNQLVMGSAGAMALGVAGLYWGVTMDGRGLRLP